MEADLQRFYNVDLRDREPLPGQRRLTLRRIAVLVKHLPSDSSVALLQRDGRPDWRLEHVLLADVWQAAAQSKKPHPLFKEHTRDVRKAAAKRRDPDRTQRLARARQRAAARKKAIAAGEIT